MVALGGFWVCMVAPGGMHDCSGGHVCLLWGRHAWLLRGGMCGCSGGGVRTIRRDTVNERAVRILLECILVVRKYFSRASDRNSD